MGWYNIYYRVNKWKNVSGIFLPVYLKYGYSVLRFIDDGTYECEEISIIKSKLETADIVLELGTGIGFIAACCAKIAGNENVYTYEANPYLEEVVKEVFEKNNVHPNFQIVLLGDKNKSNEFVPKNDFLFSSQKSGGEFAKKITVPLLDLNETIRQCAPTYLVMDIEGNEIDVFAIIDFQTIVKVQFELHPSLLKPTDIDFIFQKLADHRFVKDNRISTDKNYYFEKENAIA